jgi:hypothetical protein
MQTTQLKENQHMQNLVTSYEHKLCLKLATEVARTVLLGRSFHRGTKCFEKMCILNVQGPKLEILALITMHHIHSGQSKGIHTLSANPVRIFKTHKEISFDPLTLEAIKVQ